MELDELKNNWAAMEERLGRLEMENRRQLNKTVNSKLKQVRRRLLLRLTLVICILLPLSLNLAHNIDLHFSVLTWTLMGVFIAVVVCRQLIWMWLLGRIDCLQMTVREVCLAENRFRMSFKIGIVVSVLCAVPLLSSMVWDIAGLGDRNMLLAIWTGILIGLFVGICLLLRAWKGIKELQDAIADLE
ncbi:hypothetical protein [Bacteroides sp. UBA939]|uniref:hypothetical protein n=1 Tax=Bacteroides sp. UBA939 TaxID=1946092 RepID=UPI0025BDFAC3|nr:hypothetical protein [Bacteroides sp. UBA939]